MMCRPHVFMEREYWEIGERASEIEIVFSGDNGNGSRSRPKQLSEKQKISKSSKFWKFFIKQGQNSFSLLLSFSKTSIILQAYKLRCTEIFKTVAVIDSFLLKKRLDYILNQVTWSHFSELSRLCVWNMYYIFLRKKQKILSFSHSYLQSCRKFCPLYSQGHPESKTFLRSPQSTALARVPPLLSWVEVKLP